MFISVVFVNLKYDHFDFLYFPVNVRVLYGVRQHFESAEMAAGLQLSVTGVLGFRTVHQVIIVNCMITVLH